MIAPHCPRHGRRVLLGHDEITAVANTPSGVVVDWTCTCGHHGRTSFPHHRSTVSGRAGRLLV
jgi:hypothetical protein